MQATLLAERDAAILSLAPLVRKLARRIAGRISSNVVDVDDLESAGWVAAIRAVDAFDPSFGVPLAGYAGRVVLGAMYNELRRADPISERDRRTVRRANRTRLELHHELGREPSSAEVEARCPGYRKALARCVRFEVSYDAELRTRTGGVIRLIDFLRSETDVEVTAVADEAGVELKGAMAALDDRRRALIAQHYFEDRSLHGVAKTLEVSPQRASQLHVSALQQLQTRLAGVA